MTVPGPLLSKAWEEFARPSIGVILRPRLHYRLVPGEEQPRSGYMLENVNSSDDTRDNVVMDLQAMRYVLGTEVVTDAARHNWCAHRLQEF